MRRTSSASGLARTALVGACRFRLRLQFRAVVACSP